MNWSLGKIELKRTLSSSDRFGKRGGLLVEVYGGYPALSQS